SEADARQMALKQGQNKLEDFLAEQEPPFVWRPSLHYIDKNLVKERKEGFKDIEDVGQVKEQTLTIEVSRNDFREMANQDRVARSDLRMIFLGKVLAGLVAAFGAFAGYFRLEEATKGFYTAWLRMGAIGLVAVVAAGLYWLR